jgi:hypothetical protein
MKPKIEHLLKDLADWLSAVASVHDSFTPIIDHLRQGIQSDLVSLEQGRPFDGILRGYQPGGVVTAANPAGSDDSSERQ